jgi:hypothetical protein
MKFYRRHKHELHHHEGDAPLPPPPEKKLRYSRADDILLAKYFATKPDGTSDTLFQAFARLVSLYNSTNRSTVFLILELVSIPIIRGRVGKSTTEFTKRLLTTL